MFFFQANTKFNRSLSENKELRSDIDHMRTERTIFQNLYKKLDKVNNKLLLLILTTARTLDETHS